MSSDLGPQHLPIQNQQTLHMESMSNALAPQQLSVSNKEVTQTVSMSRSPRPQNTLIPSKQPTQELLVSIKETNMESMSNGLAPHQLSISNQEVAPMVSMSSGPRPQSTLIPSTRPTQTLSLSNIGLQQLSAPKKRMTQMEMGSHKMGGHQLSGPNKRTASMEPSPKGQTELFELVRAKLRESLADALALVSMQQNKSVENNSESAASSNLKPDNENAHLVQSISTTVDVGSCNTPAVSSPVKDTACPEINENQVLSKESSSNVNLEDATQISKHDGQEFQLKYVLLDEDVSLSNKFLLKDDFLQGNGLCWATDLEVEVAEAPELHSAKKPKLAHEEVVGDGDGQTLPSPKALAARIEAELFKLFGGVNKKYKEKGRSLIFNLKDRNNPELRERVMSGEIPPERLCSMTAEELASKELSQWRIAKAEELAQMVVLPDSGVDVRRLVKKTHKGEFQVEFEQDDGASVEVAVGGSLLSQYRLKTDEKKGQSPKLHETEASITTCEKANLEARHPQSGLTTTDGIDPMHGLVVDDLKDAEFLPPIVSLDEFMESLDSEPPFESLPAGAEQSVPISDEKSIDVGSDLESSDAGGSRNQVDTSPDKLNRMEKDLTRQGSNLKSNWTSLGLETSPGGTPKGDVLWEGSLQLNISSMAAVSGFFKSGEKTSVKEWPSFLDIKGRVKLDAFGKFLQELHMSRSRAIMVVHFCWKEGSPESGSANLSEVAESYVADERVGFAEPAPGVELYLCPPHRRTVEILGKHLPKDDTETLNAINNGLIGIVIWRKPHVTSTLSPKSSSHHKHSSKKNNHLRRQEKNSNTATPKPTASILGPPPSHPPPSATANTMVDDDDDDDVPPGFGPAVTTYRDDDDLPEFDFVGSSGMPSATTRNSLKLHSRFPPRPVEQMRELVSKYGRSSEVVSLEQQGKWQQQSSRGGIELEIQPWYDDDDIPEWRPQPLQQQQQKMPPLPPPPQSLPPPPALPSPSVQLMHTLQQQQQLQPSQMNLNLTQNQTLNNHHHFAPITPSSQQMPLIPSPQLLPQIAQRPLPMQQPLQPPMNVNVNMNVMHHHGQQQNWQAGSSGGNWPPTTGPRGPVPGLNIPMALQGIGMMQPCSLGPEDQFYGTHGPGGGGGQGGLQWRSDVSRSRGF